MQIAIHNVWELLIISILFLIIQGFIRWWISYMQKSGANKSDEEQIGLITQEVESVKSSFNEGLEKVRTSLLHLSNQTFSISTEERNAIFNFNDAYYRWFSYVENLPTSHQEIEEFDGIIQRMKELEVAYVISESRIQLFFGDERFLEVKREVYRKTHEMQRLWISYLAECFDIIQNAKSYLALPDANSETHRVILRRRHDVLKKYQDLQADVLKKDGLYDELDKLRTILSGYINKVFQQSWDAQSTKLEK